MGAHKQNLDRSLDVLGPAAGIGGLVQQVASAGAVEQQVISVPPHGIVSTFTVIPVRVACAQRPEAGARRSCRQRWRDQRRRCHDGPPPGCRGCSDPLPQVRKNGCSMHGAIVS